MTPIISPKNYSITIFFPKLTSVTLLSITIFPLSFNYCSPLKILQLELYFIVASICVFHFYCVNCIASLFKTKSSPKYFLFSTNLFPYTNLSLLLKQVWNFTLKISFSQSNSAQSFALIFCRNGWLIFLLFLLFGFGISCVTIFDLLSQYRASNFFSKPISSRCNFHINNL